MQTLFALTAALSLATSPAQALDHGAWQQVLTTHVSSSGRVDYAAIKAAGALDGYVADLAAAPLPADQDARIALWINAYNALTVDLIADNWPLASIRDLDGGKVWSKRSFTVAGEPVTLDDLEHKKLRPITDGRIHAAVNCASIGCPPLSRTAFTASGLDGQLDAAAERWAAGNGVVIDRAAKTARFNKIFDWYSEDFVVDGDTDPPGVSGKLAEAANWVAAHSSPDVAAWLRAGGYDAGWADYDWAVNKK